MKNISKKNVGAALNYTDIFFISYNYIIIEIYRTETT